MEPARTPDHRPMNIRDFLSVLKRRKWALILPAILVFMIASAVALLLPAIYKSISTVLIEEQEIPTNFVQTTVTGYAEERIQSIKQRILSFPMLRDIIERFNLYKELREKQPMEQIVDKMRDSIELKLISANPSVRRSRNTGATVAFSVSYEGKSAETVQKVANELVSLFLSENLQVRERKTFETTQFIDDEMQKSKTNLRDLDQRIAAFKRDHLKELPHLLQVNQQSLNNIEINLARLQEQLFSLKEKKEYLESQVANLPSQMDVPAMGGGRSSIQDMRAKLLDLQTRYTDSHPDVVALKAQLENLEKLEAEMKKDRGTKPAEGRLPESPAALTLTAQLASTEADLESITRQIKEQQQAAEMFRGRIEATPGVEEAYKALLLEQESLQAKYSDLMKKSMEARMAHGLEREQMGERFTLLEPALLPKKPYKPNRKVIVLAGIILGLVTGGALVFLRETIDDSVKDAFSLSMATSIPVLATIPEIRTRHDVRLRRFRKAAMAAAVVVIVAGGVFAFHYFVMDLNIFWIKISSKLGMLLA